MRQIFPAPYRRIESVIKQPVDTVIFFQSGDLIKAQWQQFKNSSSPCKTLCHILQERKLRASGQIKLPVRTLINDSLYI